MFTEALLREVHEGSLASHHDRNALLAAFDRRLVLQIRTGPINEAVTIAADRSTAGNAQRARALGACGSAPHRDLREQEPEGPLRHLRRRDENRRWRDPAPGASHREPRAGRSADVPIAPVPKPPRLEYGRRPDLLGRHT